MKVDISNEKDIKVLVDDFYSQLVVDPIVGHIFQEHMSMDMEAHLPVIYSFWQSVLLGTMTYRGNIMLKHIELNRHIQLETAHFEQWLELWLNTVDKLFAGPKADEAKQRAVAMKELMEFKVGQSIDRNFLA